MVTDTYRLVFRGEVLDGFDPVDVMARVAHAAGTDKAGMAELFSGRPVLLQARRGRRAGAPLRPALRVARRAPAPGTRGGARASTR